MSAPTLFVIAKDLTDMQVNASIDEADIGRIQSGQAVTFRVDAYPSEPSPAVVAGPPAAEDRPERRQLHDHDRRGQPGGS